MALPLLLSLLLITVLTEAVALIGKSRLTDLFFALYARIARPIGYQQQRQLKSSILQTKAELSKTSSQDEFAKWARLRRKLDKGIADLEKLNGSLSMQRTAFTAAASSVLFIVTTVLPFIYTSWHRTSAVFYLPPGWFGPVEGLVSLPFAPTGAVSCAAWGIMTRRAIKFTGRTCVDIASGFTAVSPPIAEASALGKSSAPAESVGETRKEL